MKKSFLMIAAALFILAGCQKEESVNESTSNNVIHIGVTQIAPPTKVAAVDIAANKLSFKWEEGDQVSFTDNDNYEKIIIYTCTNPATGEFSGEALDPDATYCVEYPNGYSGTFIYRGNQIPKGHFITNKEEVSGSATTFTLDTHDPIIHFKLKGDAKIGKIKLSNAQEDQPIYTLSCGDEGVQLSDEPIDFYMDAQLLDKNRLSGNAYTLSIRDIQDAELKSVSFHLKAENLGTMVDFDTPIEVNAAPSIPEGALPGVFSISATKKVHFSQGNLWYGKVGDAQTATFNFEANQYDSTPSEGGDWEASHVSHFYWSKTASVAYAASYSESGTAFTDVFFTNATAETAKSDFTVNGVTGKYRTLSTAEWQYLFNTRTMKNGKDRYTLNITYGGKMGLVLYPDDYDKDPVTGTVTDLPDGVVFLPAAGYRSDDRFGGVGDNGCYWSSSPNGESSAYNVQFGSDFVYPDIDDQRYTGLSVRLVTDASVTPAPTPTTTGTAKRTGDIDVNWVQLWENGPKFAEYNVGAENSKAEDYGGYYNWGMSDVQTSSNWEEHKSGESPLTGDDDTATKLWGSNWRMPTQTELQGLIDNCDVARTTVNDKKGSKFTGKGAYASNSVFLPAASFCEEGDVGNPGNYGMYWSSTPDGSLYAYYPNFNLSSQSLGSDYRYCGYSVRAVLAE